ncbi:MAG: sensor histidine kinase [Candidatus Odinarchaeota archaeon]
MAYPVGVIDLIGLLACLVALIILLRGWKRVFRNDTKLLLIFLLITALFHSTSNFLEWVVLTRALDPYEDLLQVLEPLLWGFFVFSFLQETSHQDMEKKNELLAERKSFAELLLDLISHDLGNYNQIILGNLQLMEKRCEEDKDEIPTNFIQNLTSAVHNSSKLISNVRILNRLLEKKIETKSLLLYPMLESARKQVQSVYPYIPLELDIRIEDRELEVTGHYFLENAFINLMTNAVRYRKSEQQAVTIEIVVEQDKEHVLVSFIDHGTGISDEHKAIVFDRFTATYQECRGSGLGLAISRRIIGAIGGKIWVENRPDSPNDPSAGSMFTIQLKRASKTRENLE